MLLPQMVWTNDSGCGRKQYLVCFDDGEKRELPSAVLTVEHMVAYLPPSHEEKILESAAGGLIQDAEKAEDVPVKTPEAA